MSREVVYSPLGVITQPNKYGKYPAGALKRGVDVCMRDPGILRAINDWQLYRLVTSSTNVRLLRMWALSASLLTACYDANTDIYSMRWCTGSSSTAITGPSSTTPRVTEAGIAQMAKARDRAFVTNDKDPWVLDSEGDTTARYIGMLRPPNIYVSATDSTDAVALANNKRAKYRAIFKRKFSDGYLLRGAPSNVVDFTNASGSTVDPNVRVDFNVTAVLAELVAGDLVSLYRTDTQGTSTDPGETYRLVKEYTLTNADIAAKYVVMRDVAPNLAPGEQLYTNSGLPENGPNGFPGQCTDAFNLKGYTWFAQRELPARVKLQAQAFVAIGATNAQRTNGIGARTGSGTSTAASAVITAVSAANMLGIVAGQKVTATNFTGVRTVVSTTASTITLDAVATGSGGSSFTAYDVIEINGQAIVLRGISDLFEVLASGDATYVAGQTGVVALQGNSIYQNSPGSGSYIYPDPIVEFELQAVRYVTGGVSLRATNGQNYAPPLPLLTETAMTAPTDLRANRLVPSKFDQPEAVVPGVETVYGHGVHYRAITRRDNALLFASDGLWQLSGEGGNWRVDLIDPKLVLAARNAVCVLEGTVYAYTERGLVAITEGNQIVNLSAGVIGDQLPGLKFANTWRVFMEADEANAEIWLFDDDSADTAFLFNVLTQTWFTYSRLTSVSALVYAPYLEAMGFGAYSSGAVGPSIYTFNTSVAVDTSVVDFQPLTGDNNAFTAKQWIDVCLLFQSIGSSPLTASVRFDEVASHTQQTTTDGVDYRLVSGVPIASAVAPRIAPGFSVPAANKWALAGVSLRYEVVSEEYMR